MIRRRNIQCYIKAVRNILIFLIIIVILIAYNCKKVHRHEVASQIPKSSLKYIFFDKKAVSVPKGNIYQIRRLLHQYNVEEKILNKDMYGPVKKDTLIFVVTVHKLSIYLEFLIVSLSQVIGVDDTLVIFSHTYFDENINTLIQSIDFCRVLQIFYPYSMQMYPNEFPGFHEKDCPHDISMINAEKYNCTGALSPDIHGRYRNPVNAEKKHFWWWTANTVFESLACTKNHTANVVFIKDDLYLLQDSIYMILYMKQISETLNQGDFLSLNLIPFKSENNRGPFQIEIKNWDPSDDPDVLSLDVTVWNSIVSHYDIFCDFDEYSWARSLYYVSLNRKDGRPFRVVSTAIPRAFKTSQCGLHGYLVDCDAIESVYQVLHLQKVIHEDMFPSNFETYIQIDFDNDFSSFDYAWSNGGFNDPRDKDFCSNLTRSKIKKTLMDMQKEFTVFQNDEIY